MAAEDLKDITAIPYFAYEPSLMGWILLGVLFLFAFLIIKYFTRPGSHRRDLNAIEKSLQELKNLKVSVIEKSDFKSITFTASLIARRLLSLLENQGISSLSENEIRSLSKSGSPELRKLLELLAELESVKYQSLFSKEQCLNQLNGLIKQLEAYSAEKSTTAKASRKKGAV